MDPVTRRIYPATELLPVEEHSFTLASEPVTKALLAREERRRERREAEASADQTNRTRVGGSRSSRVNSSSGSSVRQIPIQRSRDQQGGSHSNGSAVDKPRRGGLRSSGPSTPNGTSSSSSPSGLMARKVVRSGGAGGETALVRLSSGKIVRVPMEMLRQHQAQQQRTKKGGDAGGGTAANGAPGRTVQTRLSRLLSKINPPSTASSASTASSTTTASVAQTSVPPSPYSTTLPLGLANTLKTRLPPLPNNLAGAAPGQRIVKIRAQQQLPGSGVASSTAASSTAVTSAATSRLSERLGSISPMVVTTSANGSILIGGSSGPLAASPSSANQPVRVRCYQGPNAAAVAAQQQQQQQPIVLSNGVRLSSVLNRVVSTQQPPAAVVSQSSSPVRQQQQIERVAVVVGPNGQPISKVQLAPIVRKPGGAVVQLRGQQQQMPGAPATSQQQQITRTLTALNSQGLPPGARAIVLQQPGGGQQLAVVAPPGRQQQVQQVVRNLTSQQALPARVASGITPQQQQKLLGMMASPSKTTVAVSPQRVAVPAGTVAAAGGQPTRLLSLSPQRVVHQTVAAGGSGASPGASPQKVLVGPGGDIILVVPPQQQQHQGSAPPSPALARGGAIASSASVTPTATPPRVSPASSPAKNPS